MLSLKLHTLFSLIEYSKQQDNFAVIASAKAPSGSETPRKIMCIDVDNIILELEKLQSFSQNFLDKDFK